MCEKDLIVYKTVLRYFSNSVLFNAGVYSNQHIDDETFFKCNCLLRKGVFRTGGCAAYAERIVSCSLSSAVLQVPGACKPNTILVTSVQEENRGNGV